MNSKTKNRRTPSTRSSKPASASAAAMAAESCSEASCAEPARAKDPQHGSIIHVEFTTPDLTRGAKLYGKLFGWQFMPFQEKEMYFGTPGNWGPCGCMLQGKAEGDGRTVIYVNVDDINATLVKAKTLGATVVRPRTEIPGGHGFFAIARMPDGNTFGVYNRG
ncbi:MAG: VOC family protein [Planctomycetes bacterium]|nr:VOC family protein [Planctomycetota bacterium]